MKVPGFVWTALLALLPLLVTWLGGDYFAGQSWVPWAVIVLGFAAKAVELYSGQQPKSASLREAKRSEPSKVRKFLLGG